MTNKRYISINHQLYPEVDAKIAVSDLSIQRGFGIFDFLKTINHQPIFLEDHLDRFFQSAKEMHLADSLDREQLKASLAALMNSNQIANSGIKMILTGGFSDDGYTVNTPNLILTQVPFEIDKNTIHKDFKLMSYPHQRQLPSIKTIDYLQAIRLKPLITAKEADDVLYHHNGYVRECPRANLFMVKGKEIITPETEILKGITRSKILKMELPGYRIVAKDFLLSELAEADEVFISSSTKNAYPVIAIDGKTIGNGKMGKVSQIINEQLYQLFANQLITYNS